MKLILALMLVLVAIMVVRGSEETPKIVQASEILAKIKAGQPAEFDNCIIEGDLNLRALKIDGPVHFNHTIFRDSAIFASATFKGTAYFMSSTFNGNADFLSSTFNGKAYFVFSTFNREARFRSTTFNDKVDFESSTFNGNAYFLSSTFNGLANFSYSTFNGATYFWGSSFNGTASFWFSTFNGNVDFLSSAFKGEAYFDNTIFNKVASFDGVIFEQNTVFDSSQFKENALLDNTSFQSRLSLTKTRYNKLFIRWHAIEGVLVYDDAAYMSLLNNFKDLGYFDDYDSCYFQYRKEHRGHPWPLIGNLVEPVEKCIDFFLEVFYGYGTRPFNAVSFSIAIIGVFGIFWRAIGVGGLDDVTGEDDKGWEKPDGIFDVLSFSTTIFLSGTKLFIDPPVIPKIKGRSRSIVKKVFIVERILGALFSILFFLAISGTVIR